MRRFTPGFTLIELMIALAIAAVLLGVALPAFSAALAASHTASARAELISSLMLSVNRAAVTSRHVVICSSTDQSSCSGDKDWSQGWISFIDLDDDRQHDANETVLKRQGPLDPRVRLATSSGRTRLTIQPNGGNAGSNVTFTFCDSRGPAKAQAVIINNAGRWREGTPKPAVLDALCP